MSEKTIGRRGALKRALTVLGAAAVAPALFSACGGEESGALSCSDTSGLTPAQVTLRETQHYLDTSADPAKKCTDCNFFTAGQAAQCGTCTVIQGPIHPDGTCNLWAARI